MTIDPADFVAQGAPTVQQVRAVWESLPMPSARKVAEVLHHRGFSIHFRTVARYKASDWAAKDASKQRGPKPRQAAPIPPEQRAALDRELQVIQTSAEAPPRQPEAGADPKADPVEAVFRKRDEELMGMSENALRKLETKRRLITNIHLLEAASRKAGVMILIPKETAALVSSFTDAATAPPSSGKAEGLVKPGDEARDVTPDDPKTIDGTFTRNDQADAIAMFRRKINGTK